jgi:signal transduction histidine kinase
MEVDVADGIGTARTDEARLRQMTINLLSNAVKFTEQGSVTISAHRETAAGLRQESGEMLAIAVADTGKGIPADELPTIFDEYRQVKGQSESAVQRGTGLGLSITRRFAELLGGTIQVESTVGEGSTFTVRVPAEHAELDP